MIGRGDYHWQHEPCWYAVRSKGYWTGDRKQTTLWTIGSGGQDAETQHAEWDRLAGELGKLRILTVLDRAALAAYCGAYALWAEATGAIQKYGTMVKSPSGYPMQLPYVSIANRQAEILMRIASEFGFTPESRSRISTPSKSAPTLFDRLDDTEGKVAG